MMELEAIWSDDIERVLLEAMKIYPETTKRLLGDDGKAYGKAYMNFARPNAIAID